MINIIRCHHMRTSCNAANDSYLWWLSSGLSVANYAYNLPKCFYGSELNCITNVAIQILIENVAAFLNGSSSSFIAIYAKTASILINEGSFEVVTYIFGGILGYHPVPFINRVEGSSCLPMKDDSL